MEKRERTERDIALDRIFDELGPIDVYTEMIRMFGLQRTIGLTGYAVLWGIAGVESVIELRKKMESEGLTKTAAYEAMADFRQFGDYLYTKYHLSARPSPGIVMRKIRQRAASV